MSERKAVLSRAIERMAEFGRENERVMQELRMSGGTSLYPEGYNPTAEQVTDALKRIEAAHVGVVSLLHHAASMPPEPVARSEFNADEGLDAEPDWEY